MKSGFHLSEIMMSALVILVLWPWVESGDWPGSGPGAWQLEIENVGKLTW